MMEMADFEVGIFIKLLVFHIQNPRGKIYNKQGPMIFYDWIKCPQNP